MKTFNNFFWFLYKPADEREQAIYYKAKNRQLSFIFIVFFIFIFLDAILPGETIYGSVSLSTQLDSIFNYSFSLSAISLILIGSYIAGWTALKKEELNPIIPTTRKPRSFLLLSVITIVLVLNNLILVVVPEYRFFIGYTSLLIFSLITIAYSFYLLKGMQNDSRMFLSLLLSPFILMLGKYTKNGKYQVFRTCIASIGIFMTITILIAVSMLATMLISASRNHVVNITSENNKTYLHYYGQNIEITCYDPGLINLGQHNLQLYTSIISNDDILLFNKDKRKGPILDISNESLQMGRVIEYNDKKVKIQSCDNSIYSLDNNNMYIAAKIIK